LKEKVRFIFVDLLRGWALLIMFEVHIFNVTLLPSLKETGWFNILNFINGLVAPAFLFLSGFAFMLSTQGGVEVLRKFDYKFWRKLGRIALIFLAGYALHLPILSLRRMLNYYSPEVINSFYNVDILQCIAFGLLFLFALRLLIKSDKIFNYTVIISLFAVILFSPLIWKIDFSKFMIVPFADYFNAQHGSFFPLFPWLGFLLAGAVACKYFLDARNAGNEKNYIKQLIILGFILAAIGHFFLSELFHISFRSIKPHPLFFMERLGYVLVLLGACWYYAEWRQTRTSFVLDVGRESLIVYWLHLQIIYRRFWNDKSFASIIGGKFNVLEAAIATVVLALIMIAVAKYWGAFKRKYKKTASKLTLSIVSLAIIVFLIGF
jgi:uncharacterized membrane protein